MALQCLVPPRRRAAGDAEHLAAPGLGARPVHCQTVDLLGKRNGAMPTYPTSRPASSRVITRAVGLDDSYGTAELESGWLNRKIYDTVKNSATGRRMTPFSHDISLNGNRITEVL